MIFRIYDEGGDDQMFYCRADDGTESKVMNTFSLQEAMRSLQGGPGNLTYHKNLLNFLTTVLINGNVVLNVITVKTMDKMGPVDKGWLEPQDVIVPEGLKASPDMKTYLLLQDDEMGRGWAVLMIIRPDKTREIILQDHRDNVRGELADGDWIRSFGIDYQQEQIRDFKKLPKIASPKKKK